MTLGSSRSKEASPGGSPPRSPRSQLRIIGFSLGLAAGAAMGTGVLAIRSAPVVGGASVSLEAVPTGELAVSPAGVMAIERDLRPTTDGGVRGTVTVTNQTGASMLIGMTAVTETGMLDDVLVVQARADGEELLHGELAAIDDVASRPLSLAPGESTNVDVRVALPTSVQNGYQGVGENVRIEFSRHAAGDEG